VDLDGWHDDHWRHGDQRLGALCGLAVQVAGDGASHERDERHDQVLPASDFIWRRGKIIRSDRDLYQ
jgi:hypothetical protein